MTKASPAGEDAVSFGSALAGATRVVKSVRLCLDGELMDQIEQLDDSLTQALEADAAENRHPEAPAIAARIVELTEQARAKEVLFSFRHMGRRPWRDLIAEHPPTDSDKANGGDFNTSTFPVAAMVASCIAPTGVTQELIQELADETLTDAQWNRLWATCHAANTGGADIPLSVAAYAIARGTETSSAPRGSTEPAAASS